MKKSFTLAAAMLCIATGAYAQAVIESDVTLSMPYSYSDEIGGEATVEIAGATVTLGDEAMNTCALPFGSGTSITLMDGAKIVMFDSPDTWYPNPEDPTYEEPAIWGDDMKDAATGSYVTEIPWNLIVSGDATIELDSKCTLGGTIQVDSACTLTLVCGDSTKINADFSLSKGKVSLKYKEGAKNQTVLFGGTFPGMCPTCKTVAWSNASCKCWDPIAWVLEVEDGMLLKVVDNAHTAFPEIYGKHSIETPRTLTLRPNVDFTYDFITYSGGGLTYNNGNPNGYHFELFSGANVTMTGIIDYTCQDFYIRNKYVGLWINSDPNVPTLKNQNGSISVRNNDGFVGGIGTISSGIACKDGTTTHIIPGEGYNQIGDLTILGSIWLGNNNAIDVDFGANGLSDRLMMPNAEGACNISGANTRLWINMLDEFYTAPKAGNYKIVNAANFVPNTVYFTDTTGTRFSELDPATQSEIANRVVFVDSLITFPYTQLDNQGLVDSLMTAWANLFEQFANPQKKDRDTLFCHITKIDTTGSEVSQKVVWKTNTRENGTSCDSLPEGFSWYPVEWDELYAANPDTIAVLRDSLISKNFFERGVITIYSKDWTEVSARENVYVNLDPNAIEEVGLPAENHGRIVSSQIYTTDGLAVPSYVKGLNIIRTKYEDGTVVTEKLYSEGN